MNHSRLTTNLEIKTLSNMQFEGHGSVFGNVDWGGDVVLPGAFKRTLAEHRSNDSLPGMLWAHDQKLVIGKWLSMHEDDRGLVAKGELAPTDLGKEIHTLLKMEAVKGLSIGYIPTDVDYQMDGVRLIKEVDLIELSVVAIPMNPKAQIQHVKSRLSAKGEYVPTENELAELKRDTERFLRSRGFNRKMATQFALNMFKEIFDPSEMLESKNIPSVMPEEKTQEPSATPDELEVLAGLTDFHEKQISYDLEKRFKQIFG